MTNVALPLLLLPSWQSWVAPSLFLFAYQSLSSAFFFKIVLQVLNHLSTRLEPPGRGHICLVAQPFLLHDANPMRFGMGFAAIDKAVALISIRPRPSIVSRVLWGRIWTLAE
jgi:hypothetical protein